MPGREKQTPRAASEKPFVLVAEDEKTYARIYQMKLEQEGFAVQVVSDGSQVVQAARARKPNVILLDMVMPVQDGFTTLKELKADKTLSRVNVIIFSNLGQDEDIRKAKDLGAAAYLVKADISVQEMVDAVRAHLK